VILPTYLSPDQRRRIYNPRAKQYLVNDPVTIEIDGVVHKFRYINQVTDIPSTRKVLQTAIKSMQTPDDFRNIRPLLEGCVRANRKLPPTIFPLIVRKAAQSGNLEVVFECIQNAEDTDFYLNRSELINSLLAWIQWPAIRGGFKAGDTKTALRRVNHIIETLEGYQDVHEPSEETRCAFPFHRDPQILAARLHMAAALAVHHRGGKDDENGSVGKYAADLVSVWPEDKGLLDLQPDEAYLNPDKMAYMLNRSMYLFIGAPVLNGLTLATQVVDPALAMQLQNRADKVEEEVKAALNSPELKKGGLGEQMYNALYNREAGEWEDEE
jgi:hypothetical protein